MKFLSFFSVAAILGFSLLAGNSYAQDLTMSQTKTLAQAQTKAARYSIAIRGGASKGAYEAGLNWSLLKFMREISDSRKLAGERTFQIELESITGASAGGINTLLSGLTWCSRSEKDGGISNRIDDNIFRDIWLVGATSFVLQSATYKSPETTFSPSTAPDNWVWRNIIPFEIGFDLMEGDLIFSWLPTMALTKKDLLGLRASLGFAGGLFTSSKDETRENYLGLGVSYTRKMSYWIASSFGVTPTWYYNIVQPAIGERDTLGGEVHINFLKDRLRIGLGTRDFENTSDNVFITLSVNDIPGVIYWLTR